MRKWLGSDFRFPLPVSGRPEGESASRGSGVRRPGAIWGRLRSRPETVPKSEPLERRAAPPAEGSGAIRVGVTQFRFRRLAQSCHGFHGGESRSRCVPAAAGGPPLATGQVFGAFAHLQRTGEPAAHRVAAGEELLREVEGPCRAGAGSQPRAARRRLAARGGQTLGGLAPAPSRACSRLSLPAGHTEAPSAASVSRALVPAPARVSSESCVCLMTDRSGFCPRPFLKGLTSLSVPSEVAGLTPYLSGRSGSATGAGSPEPAFLTIALRPSAYVSLWVALSRGADELAESARASSPSFD